MKRIIIGFSGGFGNQLFQLAFSLQIKRLFTEDKIYFDSSFYDAQNSIVFKIVRFRRKIPKRNFELLGLLRLFEIEDVKIIRKDLPLGLRLLLCLNKKLVPVYYSINLLNTKKICVQNDDSYNIDTVKYFSHIYFRGYWQNVSRIDWDNTCIKNYFKKYLKSFNLPKTIVLHIRRGDQATDLSKEVYPILDFQYYQMAIESILKFAEIDQLVICSDEIDWCKINLKLSFNGPINFSWATSAIEDFNLMVNSEYLISSNSTFAWWAAMLGDKKIVVMPELWCYDPIVQLKILNSNILHL